MRKSDVDKLLKADPDKLAALKARAMSNGLDLTDDQLAKQVAVVRDRLAAGLHRALRTRGLEKK